MNASEVTAAQMALVYEAIRFAVWAAGEGLSPIAGEDALGPEDFLMDYSVATGEEEWETLADRFPAALLRALEARSLSALPEGER